ncbi:enoyl-CoA hydratase [Rhodococcus sp. 06-156-3C]|uniref:enoyl-CoA hydratase-related protein n=1 Tax=Nocardiaceae TaxID=85025 RepID=UPI000522E9C5|nr:MULTISPECIES: enoyl-CoA hydratase-related protein [Rhodococcus]OZD19336.1 enoyl-CoA hydratase [Rhodococcus sp. 06-156-3C]OZD21671.1 enoyl-CoA hydratase [Rhodococcus sp. 06-156-4C]OZD25356.1 enoyl-CoA hydratase [Rhodococcus sp. 06-156-4a]OZD33029.1 enoyl-CoA hydratase [Rhodococcus sp. 06-156-3b]OZD41895.1 enoyl-CoA hydratase [Rhodococcus sp. 06-156-3]
MTVRLDKSDGLATITLERSSLNVETKVAFQEAVDGVSGARAVLVTAEGKNFCVGQDLAEHVEALQSNPKTAMDTVGIHYNPLIRSLKNLDVPVVVAIPGACVGAGLGIALAGDVRVAGTGSSFATAFTGIGLASDSGLSYSLVESLGSSRAGALMLLGDKITAEQALDWGLVHRVVPDEEVRDAAAQIARKLATGPTEAYRHVKSLVRASASGLFDALDREARAQTALGQTVDHKAAVDAFLAKAKPVFQGH